MRYAGKESNTAIGWYAKPFFFRFATALHSQAAEKNGLAYQSRRCLSNGRTPRPTQGFRRKNFERRQVPVLYRAPSKRRHRALGPLAIAPLPLGEGLSAQRRSRRPGAQGCGSTVRGRLRRFAHPTLIRRCAPRRPLVHERPRLPMGEGLCPSTASHIACAAALISSVTSRAPVMSQLLSSSRNSHPFACLL